ncbi:MAG: hypothetical protein K8T26_02765 [Lentisphaerae bacterium]|nr:hypothetical protein [Lentisphaerota bacterium]
MAETGKTPDRADLRIDELVLTRVGDDTVIRPLDGVTMEEVKRYVQAERSRNRRTVVWTGTLLLGVFLFFLVIFLSIGIYVIHARRATGDSLLALRAQHAADVAALATVSNRVGLLENVQVDLNRLLVQVESSDITRTRELDGVLADISKIRGWVDEMDTQRKESLSQIDQRLQSARTDATQEIASVRAEIERLLDTVQSGQAPAGESAGIPPGALEGLPAFGEAASPSPTPSPDLEQVPLTEQGLADAGLFQTGDDEPFDPGAERREITVVDFPNGDHYEGEMDHGLCHGWGIYNQRNGDRYDGQFEDGLKAGRGTLVYASGEKYIGEFRADLRAGRGSLSYANGDRYAGDFANDMPSGRGIMLYANGNKYAGYFLNGQRNGPGILRFANGDIYRGEFQADARTGKGTYVFADGSRYEGEFLDGRRQGHGRYVYSNGEAYDGEFRDGARQGMGTSILPNGKTIKGLWDADKLVKYLPDQQ